MRIHSSPQKGFTLIEVLIALGIMAMLVVSVANMIVALSAQDRKNRAVMEVDTAASSLMDDITQSLRNASSIATPATSTVSSTTLSLNLAGLTAENPTTFSFANQTILVAKGTSTSYRMTNTNVKVNSVTFQNLSPAVGDGTVRVTLSVSDIQNLYTTTIISTVALR